MKKYLLIFNVVILSILCIAKLGEANSNIKICYESWEPYYWQDQKNNFTGPVIDIVNNIYQKQGFTIEYTELPFARCLANLKAGIFDGFLSVSPTVTNVRMSKHPIAYWTLNAIVRSNDSFEHFLSMAQFSHYRVLLHQDYDYPTAITDYHHSWKSVIPFTYKAKGRFLGQSRPYRMIARQRADVLFEDFWTASSIIRTRKLDLKILQPSIAIEPNYLAFQKDDLFLATLFDMGMDALIANGKAQAIYKRYFGKDWQYWGSHKKNADLETVLKQNAMKKFKTQNANGFP